MKKTLRFISYLLFLCYMAGISSVFFGYHQSYFKTVMPDQQEVYMNLVPLKTIIEDAQACWYGQINFSSWITHLASSFLLFVPLGIFLPLLFVETRKFSTFLFLSSIMILIIEAVQLVLRRGCFNMDDLILGLVGASLGFLILHTKGVPLKLTNKFD